MGAPPPGTILSDIEDLREHLSGSSAARHPPIMFRSCAARFLTLCALGVASSAGCATYSKDMERVRTHYTRSEFPAALGLLRVLGDDQGLLSKKERVQYAYLRGMTDFRLGASAVKVADRVALRRASLYWLERASERSADEPEALIDAERERMTSTLRVLRGKSDAALGESELE
jgi:hypothetical protein